MSPTPSRYSGGVGLTCVVYVKGSLELFAALFVASTLIDIDEVLGNLHPIFSLQYLLQALSHRCIITEELVIRRWATLVTFLKSVRESTCVADINRECNLEDLLTAFCELLVRSIERCRLTTFELTLWSVPKSKVQREVGHLLKLHIPLHSDRLIVRKPFDLLTFGVVLGTPLEALIPRIGIAVFVVQDIGSLIYGYAQRSFAPEMALKYPTRESRLSKNHLEFRQLVTVLLLAISEVQKIQTPIAVRSRYLSKTTRLSSLYGNIPKPRMCDRFVEHASDPLTIREAKHLANVILQHQSTRRRPWRVDYAILFEHYVQHLFREVAQKRSCSLVCNPCYSISGRAPAWALRYLEPDIVLQREDDQLIIDAKYKSHMLNRGTISDGLKESFRRDLHQVLAYSSFGTAENKQVILVYPAEVFICQQQQISNPLTRATTNVHLVGIPLGIAKIGEAKCELDKLIARSL